MKILFCFLLCVTISISGHGQFWTVFQEMPVLEPVSNNAVVGITIDGVDKVYSFTGIDDTKQWDGIHLRAFTYNTNSQVWATLPDVPDTQGKIGVAASPVDTMIYIMGGYHVNSNGTEVTSAKVHRFDAKNDVFIADGQDIPVPTDDHVQAVWKDSLIFLVTGWSNSGNIPEVQIYNPYTDSWQMGTSVPNNQNYKSFGASGTIIGDTLFYFGGANSDSFTFAAQKYLRKGFINPNDPTQITWSDIETDSVGYRSACVIANNRPYWIGGSNITYNYNGIAYNNSGGVPPSKRIIGRNSGDHWVGQNHTYAEVPMDLRGAAVFPDGDVYVVGGMLGGQMVTDQVLKLNWQSDVAVESYDQNSIRVFPNPGKDVFVIESTDPLIENVELYNSSGQLVQSWNNQSKRHVVPINLESGTYIIQVTLDDEVLRKRWVKL